MKKACLIDFGAREKIHRSQIITTMALDFLTPELRQRASLF